MRDQAGSAPFHRGHAFCRQPGADDAAAGTHTRIRPAREACRDDPTTCDRQRGCCLTMVPRVLVVVGTDVARDSSAGPRRDYSVLARRLDANIIDLGKIQRSWSARVVQRLAGNGPAQAWLAFRQRQNVDVIVTDGERSGIPLALLLRLARSRVGHV